VLRLRKIILGLLWFVPFVYGIAAVSIPFFIYQLISVPAQGYDSDAIAEPSHRLLFLLLQTLLILLGISPVAIYYERRNGPAVLSAQGKYTVVGYRLRHYVSCSFRAYHRG